MAKNPNRPRKDDAVLGTQVTTPVDGVVLGGIEGVKRRLASGVEQQQILALHDSLNYGEAGLDLVMQASKFETGQVQHTAEKLLLQKRSPQFQQKLLEYNHWLFFDCLFTLKGHSDKVNSVAISPDKLTLASASNDKSIKVWFLPTGEIQRTLEGHFSKVNWVVFSSNGLTLVSCSNDNTIKMWDWQTGEVKSSLEAVHSNSVDAIALSPGGTFLISASWNIKVWNLHSGRIICTLQGHSGYISSLAISPKGRIFVSDSNDTINVWELHTGNPWGWKERGTIRHSLKGHSGKVNAIAISADGLVLGGLEGVKRRLSNSLVEQKIAALQEALKYGEAGLDLVIQALEHKLWRVRQAAYLLLEERKEPIARQVLQEYTQKSNRYEIFVAMGRTGGVSDVDTMMESLENDHNCATYKLVDYALGLVDTHQGKDQIRHYLFHGTQRQRNYAALYFKRLGAKDILVEAVRCGCIDRVQAFSK